MSPRWLARSIRPPDDPLIPNDNDPASVPPATVGPPSAVPGDPHGLTVEGPDPPATPPPTVWPSSWSGWPADWLPPAWGGMVNQLTDTAWMCVDLNSSLLSTMPPYLVGAAPSLDSGWLTNPDPDLYTSWAEFAKQMFWDYHLGETFVLATSRYTTGWPARFHVVPPYYVDAYMGRDGLRKYTIGALDVTADMLHIRYRSSVDYAHGYGPLEAGAGKLIAAQMLSRYVTNLASAGGIPSSVLEVPEPMTAAQATELRNQWVQARLDALGAPAVVSGGATWKATQMNPTDMALLDLVNWNDARIAQLLGVPPTVVGLPAGDQGTLTYKNIEYLFDRHWRTGLRPKAEAVTAALSNWLLPRGTTVEVNQNAYTEPDPLARAQTAQTLNSIVDPVTGQPALTVDEIRAAERLNTPTLGGLAPAVTPGTSGGLS